VSEVVRPSRNRLLHIAGTGWADLRYPYLVSLNWSAPMPAEDLRETVWREIADLFEGDEDSARDWMSRPRIPLGHATPAEMLGSPEDIARLRQFIQQIQRGIVP